MRVTAVIADDEPLARRKLATALAEYDWIELVRECADGLSTAAAVDDLRPDVLFLDIRMPGLSGLQVLERITHSPRVVFTTAFDRYAVAAFDLQALDYLVKPFGRERLARTLERIHREILVGDRGAGTAARARDALAGGSPTRIFVRDSGRIIPILLGDVVRFEARDDYVAIHSRGKYHLVQLTLSGIEGVLDPEKFYKIHRSHIVNLDRVRSLVPCDGNRLQVEMDDGSVVVASRNRSRKLRDIVL